jgi:hypothetical protein
VTVNVAFALPTVSELLPLAGPNETSPAQVAAAPVAYGDPLTLYELPQRVTTLLVATPLALVIPLPAGLPFRVKVMLLPGTGLPPEVSVAVNVVVPP